MLAKHCDGWRDICENTNNYRGLAKRSYPLVPAKYSRSGINHGGRIERKSPSTDGSNPSVKMR